MQTNFDPYRTSSNEFKSDPLNSLPSFNQTDKKTYSLARRIFEGIGLVLLNIATAFTINLELLRGDNSFLKREYERVFLGKEISMIVSNTSGKYSIKPQSSIEEDLTNVGSTNRSESEDSVDHEEDEFDLTVSPFQEESEEGALVTSIPQNPYVGKTFTMEMPPLSPESPQGLKFTFTVLEMNFEIKGMKPNELLESSPLLPIEGPSTLPERDIVPAQKSGVISSIGSALSSGWKVIVGEEEPRFKADATILVEVNKIQHLIKISLDTPLAGAESPMDMVLNSLHQQLPEQLRGAENKLQILNGRDHMQGQALLTMPDIATSKDDDLLRPSKVPHNAVFPFEERSEGLVGSAPIAALVASTALFEKAFVEELQIMANVKRPAPTINPVKLYGMTPGIGTLSWLAKTGGASSKLGFNPTATGVVGTAFFLAVMMFSRRNHTYQHQRKTVSQNHAVSQVTPEQKDRGYLGWIWDVIKNMASSTYNTVVTLSGRAKPLASAKFTTGTTKLRFDYLACRHPVDRFSKNSFLFEKYRIKPQTLPGIIIEEK